jgi:MFS family permease
MAARLARLVPDLLRQPVFRRYWTAQTVSYLGDQVTTVALPLTAIIALRAGPGETGLLAAFAFLPNLLFSLHLGGLVDRIRHRRRVMIAADLSRAVLLATIPIAYLLGGLTVAHVYAVAFAAGTLAIVFNICGNSLFTRMVPRERYVAGNSLVSGSYSFSWVAGPGIGGVIVQALSGPIALLVDVASFLGSALLLGSIRPPEPEPERPGLGHLRAGLRFVRRTPELLVKVYLDAGLNFFYMIYFAVVLLFLAKELVLPPTLIGVVLGVGAVGALLGSAAAGAVSRRAGVGPAFLAGALLYPGALLAVPLAGGPRWFTVGLVVLGEFASAFGLMVCDIAGSSIQQAVTPDRLRARVQGAGLLFNNGVRPIGALAGGALGTWLGVRTTLVVAAGGGVAYVVLVLGSRLRQMRELPGQALADTAELDDITQPVTP